MSGKSEDKYTNLRKDSVLSMLMDMANNIFAELGPGHTESVYHKAFLVELKLRNIPYESEVVIPITYKNHQVGYGRADIIVYRNDPVYEPVVIELKAIGYSYFKETDLSKLRTYMKFSRISKGLMVNFPQLKVSECVFEKKTLDFQELHKKIKKEINEGCV